MPARSLPCLAQAWVAAGLPTDTASHPAAAPAAAAATAAGSNLFITAVVFGVVVLTSKGDHSEVPDRRAFVRDVTAYLLACLLMLALCSRGSFGVLESAFMVAAYCAYLLVCILTSRGHRAMAPSLSQHQLHMLQHQQLATAAAHRGGSAGVAGLQPLVLRGGPGAGAGAAAGVGGGSFTPRTWSPTRGLGADRDIEMVLRPGGPSGSTAVSRKPTGAAAATAAAGGGGGGGGGAGGANGSAAVSRKPTGAAAPAAGGGAGGANGSAQPWALQSSIEGEQEGGNTSALLLPAQLAGAAASAAADSRLAESQQPQGWAAGLLGAWRSLLRLLHLEGQRGPWLVLALAGAPALLLLHLTMPSLHRREDGLPACHACTPAAECRVGSSLLPSTPGRVAGSRGAV